MLRTMIASLCLASSAAFGLGVDYEFKGDCADAILDAIPNADGSYSIIATLAGSMSAVADDSQKFAAKNCTISWELELGPKEQFSTLEVETKGEVLFLGEGSAWGTMSHLAAVSKRVDVQFNYKSSDYPFGSAEPYIFGAKIYKSQLPATAGKCNSTVEMVTQITSKAVATSGTIVNSLTNIVGQPDAVEICKVIVNPCP